MDGDFFDKWFHYTAGTEPPKFFYRWTAMLGIASILGRRFYFKHGHFNINPNIYCMLIGVSGTRKSTAIKLMRKLLIAAGYTTIAADKTTKEKFLLDLEGDEPQENGDDILNINLWGTDSSSPREVLIAADEANDFFGINNMEFLSMLGTLWNYEGVYESRIKSGKSVAIPDPTINILSGNTPTNFAAAFPPEIIGQGFFSRILLVYAPPSKTKITFPRVPDSEATAEIISMLQRIKQTCVGHVRLERGAEQLIHEIYQSEYRVADVRFDSYNSRRLDHLIKCCLVVAAARLSCTITEQDVIYANTVLTFTEKLMPRALGEFGKAKNSDISHKVLSTIETAEEAVGFKQLWTLVHNDLESQRALGDILQNLAYADKIQIIDGTFLPKLRVAAADISGFVDYSLLTTEEQELAI